MVILAVEIKAIVSLKEGGEEEELKAFYFIRNFKTLGGGLAPFSRDCVGFRLILYHCGFKVTALFHENNISGFRAADR